MSPRDEELIEESRTYETHVSEWASHEGEFVLIRGSEVIGFFETYEEALSQGYQRFGLVPFFVKKVLQQHQGHFVSRLVAPHVAR